MGNPLDPKPGKKIPKGAREDSEFAGLPSTKPPARTRLGVLTVLAIAGVMLFVVLPCVGVFGLAYYRSSSGPSDNAGKLEGTKWRYLGGKVGSKDVAAGAWTFDFGKDGRVRCVLITTTFSGWYELSGGNRVKMQMSPVADDTARNKTFDERITIDGDRMTMIDGDGTHVFERVEEKKEVAVKTPALPPVVRNPPPVVKDPPPDEPVKEPAPKAVDPDPPLPKERPKKPPRKPIPLPEPMPDPDEPKDAPRGWVTLFRADDPSVWNTDSPGDKFAMPLAKAHSKIRYVRLKRMDKGDYLILPITRAQLGTQTLPDRGCTWNGSGKREYGGYHLGIGQPPRYKFPALPRDVIAVPYEGWDSFSGSGFGHKLHINNGQFYCWLGKEIPKTTFEIAVSADALTEDERAFLMAGDGEEGAPPKGWMVLFRADDPALWNTISAGKSFAMPAWRAHSKIEHLRLTRMDTGAALIIPITRDALTGLPQPFPEAGSAWNGSGQLDQNVVHLGIIEGPGVQVRLAKDVLAVGREKRLAFKGSGFGSKPRGGQEQGYGWQGVAIPKTAFEIAVTADPLTDKEVKLLVK